MSPSFHTRRRVSRDILAVARCILSQDENIWKLGRRHTHSSESEDMEHFHCASTERDNRGHFDALPLLSETHQSPLVFSAFAHMLILLVFCLIEAAHILTLLRTSLSASKHRTATRNIATRSSAGLCPPLSTSAVHTPQSFYRWAIRPPIK